MEPGRPQDVPLFLALHLTNLNICHIQRPSWLNSAHLNNILIEELQSESNFAPGIPTFYYEVFNALDKARVESIQECRSLITRICLVRSQKIRSKQVSDFQYAGSAEIRLNRMIILGCKI